MRIVLALLIFLVVAFAGLFTGGVIAGTVIERPHFRLIAKVPYHDRMLVYYLNDKHYHTLDECIADGVALPDPPPGMVIACTPAGPPEQETRL